MPPTIAWFVVITVSLVLGYLLGYNVSSRWTQSQYERILKAEHERTKDLTADYRATIASLEGTIESMRMLKNINDALEELKPFVAAIDGVSEPVLGLTEMVQGVGDQEERPFTVLPMVPRAEQTDQAPESGDEQRS